MCVNADDTLRMNYSTEDLSNDKSYFLLELSMWAKGCSKKKVPIRDRLRYCFNILFTGTIYTDQIILGWNSTKQLRNDLTDILKNYEGG